MKVLVDKNLGRFLSKNGAKILLSDCKQDVSISHQKRTNQEMGQTFQETKKATTNMLVLLLLLYR